MKIPFKISAANLNGNSSHYNYYNLTKTIRTITKYYSADFVIVAKMTNMGMTNMGMKIYSPPTPLYTQRGELVPLTSTCKYWRQV
jgi:hypothetical protein